MKLGVVGLGRRMASLLKEFQKAAPDLRLVGVVDTRPGEVLPRVADSFPDVKFFESLAHLMEAGKPDAIAIGTRCDSHASLAMEAAKYRCPVFLEKPVAINLDQAEALENAFLGSDCPVLVSFPLRASPLCRRVKSLLERGAIGPAEHVLATNYVAYGDVYFRTSYRDYAITQGLFLQKATHDFDYLAWLIGSSITRVAAMTSLGRVYRDSGSRSGHAGEAIYLDQIGTPETGMNEDSSSALLEFADGTKGVYTQVFFSKRMPRRGATLSGVKGTLEFDWYTNQITTVSHSQPFRDVSTVEGEENHFGGDRELARCFIAMVKENAPSMAPIGTGLASAYACLAAKESAETGRFVQVRQTKLPLEPGLKDDAF